MRTETITRWKSEWRFAAAVRRPRNPFATALILRSVSMPRKRRSQNQRNNAMRHSLPELVAFLAAANLTCLGGQVSPEPTISGEHIALVGGTVINPADGKITRNATVFIDNGRITNIKSNIVMKYGGRTIDCVGKFILPGYIDTHVHFFQSADLFTRPDGADFNSIRPYKDEVAWIKSHLDDVFARYIRSGITSVVDVGGPMWNFEVRKKANATAKAPRVAAAGPLISSVSREKLDLGDPPIVKIDSPDQAREFVRKLAEQKPDLVKIWYIVDKDHPVDSFRPIVRATIEESHAHKIRVAVHATELETARAAVEEGADVLVHRVVANKLNLTAEEKAWGNPEVIASLDVTKIPSDKLPDRIKTALAKPEDALDGIKKTYDVALKNLK